MEGSRVELAENRLILGQFYSTLLYSLSPYPSIQIDHELVLEPRSLSFPKVTGAMLSKVKPMFKSNSRAQ